MRILRMKLDMAPKIGGHISFFFKRQKINFSMPSGSNKFHVKFFIHVKEESYCKVGKEMCWKACSNECNECSNLQGRRMKIKVCDLWPRKFPLLDGKKSCNLRGSYKVCDLQFFYKSYSNQFNVPLKFHLAKSTIEDTGGKLASSYFSKQLFKIWHYWLTYVDKIMLNLPNIFIFLGWY
jgi:hypothetical protein